ncbi:MAG: hypothetical protein IRZ16_07365 [Myxococcaceae bacterium]|nr:hypothetical protein [Myxococcaceae bacterium]
MTDRTRIAVLVAVCLSCTAWAGRRVQKTPELDEARDRLLAKIVRGEELDASIAALKALVEQRDALIPTSARARAEEEEFNRVRRSWEEDWRKTADSEVAWRCRLEADPSRPHENHAAGVPEWPSDWGVVTRREQIHVEGENALDEGETWTVYEVKGRRRTYRFRAKGFGIFRRERFEAEKGDLVLVCDGGTSTEEKLPPGWRENFQRSGFAVRLRSPPKIAQKAKWNPLQITDTTLYWTIKDVKWRFRGDTYVLDNIAIAKDLGQGRYLIDVDVGDGLDAIVEVPPGLPRRELMVPGTRVWAILGHPRFDKSVRKLVLTVEDLEERYIDEVPFSEEASR